MQEAEDKIQQVVSGLYTQGPEAYEFFQQCRRDAASKSKSAEIQERQRYNVMHMLGLSKYDDEEEEPQETRIDFKYLGLEAISELLGRKCIRPRSRVTVMVLGSVSAGKSSFINWYCGRQLLESGEAIKTLRLTVVAAGDREALLTSQSTLRNYAPHILHAIEGSSRPRPAALFQPAPGAGGRSTMLEQLVGDGNLQVQTFRILGGQESRAGSVDLVDTLGLDKGLEYPFEVDEALMSVASACDLILVFRDSADRSPNTRTAEIVQRLNERKISTLRMAYVLSRADGAASDGDLSDIHAQATTSLSPAVRDKHGLRVIPIWLPAADRALLERDGALPEHMVRWTEAQQQAPSTAAQARGGGGVQARRGGARGSPQASPRGGGSFRGQQAQYDREEDEDLARIRSEYTQTDLPAPPAALLKDLDVQPSRVSPSNNRLGELLQLIRGAVSRKVQENMEVLIRDASHCGELAEARLKAHDKAKKRRAELQGQAGTFGLMIALLLLAVVVELVGRQQEALLGWIGGEGGEGEGDLLAGMARAAVQGTGALTGAVGSAMGVVGLTSLQGTAGRVLLVLMLALVLAGLIYVWNWRAGRCEVMSEEVWMATHDAWRQCQRLVVRGNELTKQYTRNVAGHAQSDRIGKDVPWADDEEEEEEEGEGNGARRYEEGGAGEGLRQRASAGGNGLQAGGDEEYSCVGPDRRL